MGGLKEERKSEIMLSATMISGGTGIDLSVKVDTSISVSVVRGSSKVVSIDSVIRFCEETRI